MLSDPREHRIAYSLVVERSFGVSAQNLAEFTNVTRRKSTLSDEQVDAWLSYLGALPFVAVDQALVQGGLLMARRYRISYYDGAIVAAAEHLGAKVLYTEDLNHNQLYGSVVAINPFIEH